LERILGKPPGWDYVWKEGTEAERSAHQRALIELGFLERREFVLSNQSFKKVLRSSSQFLAANSSAKKIDTLFWEIPVASSNLIVIIARRKDMPILAEAIRKADVP